MVSSLFRWWLTPTPPVLSREQPFDVVVPLDYGALKEGHERYCPYAALLCLQEAARCLRRGFARSIAWGSVSGDELGPGAGVMHREKIQHLKEWGTCPRYIAAEVECVNSMTEARELRRVLGTQKRILVVCDWPHARRTAIIWKQYFPEAEIAILTVNASWHEPHESFILRGKMRWIAANLYHFFALRFVSRKKLERVTHKKMKH